MAHNTLGADVTGRAQTVTFWISAAGTWIVVCVGTRALPSAPRDRPRERSLTPNPHPCAPSHRRLDTAASASSRLPGLMGAR
jgi:hypothetical protein